MRTPRGIWLLVGLSAACYLLVNGLFVFVPFLPGLATFLAWTIVLPVLSVGMHWLLLARARKHFEVWWILGIIASAYYGLLGYLSGHAIAAMWAAV